MGGIPASPAPTILCPGSPPRQGWHQRHRRRSPAEPARDAAAGSAGRIGAQWLTLPPTGQIPQMVIVVTRVGGDGSVLTRSVHCASRADPDRWNALVEQASLQAPRPYRPEPGEPVYGIWVDGLQVQVAERDLRWPLRELVIAVLAEGDDHREPPAGPGGPE